MRRLKNATQLDVAGLLAHGSLRATKPLYVTSSSAKIDGVVLVTQLDAIQRVRPNTVVVLSAEMGSGGWLVSAALRHAWERRASAVIIADITYSGAVVGLAQRLGITLLAAVEDPAAVALTLAGEIGAALAVVDAELARFARAVAKSTSLGDVLECVSRELGGVEVSLEHAGVVLTSAGTPSREAVEVITMDVRGSNTGTSSRISARVPKSGVQDLQLVRSMLEVAHPSVTAAWLLEGAAETARAVPTEALVGLGRGPDASGVTFEERHRHLLAQLGWRHGGQYVAVWIGGESPEDQHPELTAVLRLLWRKIRRDSTLAEVPGGWLALVPIPNSEAADQLETRSRVRLGATLEELGLSVGLSRWKDGPTELTNVVQEARLAARFARSTGPGSVAGFAGLDVAAVTTFVDTDAVALVAQLTMPRLMVSPDRELVIAAVVAFLNNHGSVSLAAKMLDLHRNTLQTRLNRARELGVPLDIPSKLLSAHLILSVLQLPAENEPRSTNPISNDQNRNQKGLS